ncbi:MAG: DegV family protein [Oscillibacter sp.]|nr:DegV family protein [Oscillibacter sp.]
MREFVIMTDSCCDLPQQLVDELGVVVLPLTVLIGENSYKNYPDGREIGFKEFYDTVRGGAMPTTSAVSVGDFEDAMRPILAEGKDILCLNFSAALSTTYQSASIAAEELKSEFPDADIRVLDTRCASVGQGLLIYLCSKLHQEGKSLEETYAYAVETAPHVAHWVTVDDLNHLKRGGRISATTALFGTMLTIKPIIHVDEEGRLINVGKARGRKAALKTIVDEMEKRLLDPSIPVFISHGDCEEDAKAVAEDVKNRLGCEVQLINYVGPVIGAHTGAGVVALCFVGKER